MTIDQGIGSIIALLVAYIAFQQYKTAKDKLKLDLYNKRFKVYTAAKKLVGTAVAKGDLKQDDIFSFWIDVNEAQFLFGKIGNEIYVYMDLLNKQGFQLNYLGKRIRDSQDNKEKENLLEKRDELFKWFEDQITELPKKFSKYLSINET